MSNSISFLGRLGQDAEVKNVGDTSVLEFSTANNVGFGEKKSTIWFRCSLWGKRGESIEQYMRKGTTVFVTGELTINSYTNKDGDEKQSIDVRVANVDFAGKSEEGHSAPSSTPAAQPQAAQQAMPAPADDSDSMPF